MISREKISEALNAFLRRFPTIIASFFFALVIWFFVSMTKPYATTKSVPIIVKIDKSRFAIKSKIPKEVEVKFEGIGWKILSLYFTEPEWIIELGQEIEDNVISIETTKNAMLYLKYLPDGLTVLNVQPDLLTLRLDEKITKRLPIRLRAKFEPVVGYIVSDRIMLQPDSVTVSGSRSHLENMTYWETKNTEFTGLGTKFKFDVELSDTLAGLVALSTKSTVVTGSAEQLAELEFNDLPVEIEKHGTESTVTLIPSRVKVVVGGGLSELAGLIADSIHVRIRYDDIIKDTTGALTPSITVPKRIKLLRSSPEQLQYILRK
ncbi:MAG: hypothetical protein HGB11_13265 [Chlorobiales bacterium]|nr:hypothetical protein [Chlorobiales bacterium]